LSEEARPLPIISARRSRARTGRPSSPARIRRLRRALLRASSERTSSRAGVRVKSASSLRERWEATSISRIDSISSPASSSR